MKSFRLKLTVVLTTMLTISVATTGMITMVYLYVRGNNSSIDEAYQFYELWVYFAVGLFILIIIGAIISYHLAGGILTPLKNIMIVARQISQKNYQARVRIQSNDEFGQLGLAINHMVSNLNTQMNNISENQHRLESVLDNMSSGVIMIDRDQNIALMNRFAERIVGISVQEAIGKQFDVVLEHPNLIEAIQQCIVYRDPGKDELVFQMPMERIFELNLAPVLADYEWLGVVIVLHDITEIRRLEKVRSEFVANVSHELKTPIASVKGFAETLLRGDINDKEAATSFLQTIFDESERLNRLINDILELSKIESKQLTLNYEPVDMSQLVKETIHIFRAAAEEKKVNFELRANEGTYIEADEDRIRQIIINLISNGLKHMPDGGKLTISVAPLEKEDGTEHDQIRMTVADTGLGIPEADLLRIFERFYLVDKARSRNSGGTGLGLSIVKHLVELHQGTINVESQLGIGTQFHIDLPVIQ